MSEGPTIRVRNQMRAEIIRLRQCINTTKVNELMGFEVHLHTYSDAGEAVVVIPQ